MLCGLIITDLTVKRVICHLYSYKYVQTPAYQGIWEISQHVF